MLRQLSQETGGRAFFPTDGRRAAEDLRADLRGAGQPVHASAYVVEEPDAQRRLAAVVVRVTRPGLIGRTRQGYYATGHVR